MKMKRVLLLMFLSAIAFTMIGCPTTVNRPPKIMQLVDDELVDINEVVYHHPQGTAFDPEDMITDLVENQNIIAIDYNQTKLAIGKDREYYDISDQLMVTSFYQIWLDGDDANNDGVVDEADEEFYGTIKTDDDGNYVYDQGKIMLVQFLPAGQEISFTMKVTDDEGESSEVTGKIIIS